MGLISDTISNAWRTYVIPNVPASGVNEPDKAEIRAIGPVIEARIDAVVAGQAAGVYIYATRAELYANLVPVAGSRGEVVADSDPAKNGIYTKVGATTVGSWTFLSGVEGTVATTARLIATAARLDALKNITDQFRQTERVVYNVEGAEFFRPDGTGQSWGPAGGWNFLAKAFDPIRSFRLAAVLMPLVISSSVAYLDYRLYRRLRASPSDLGPGAVVGDEVLIEIRTTPAAAGLDTTSVYAQMGRFPFVDIDVSPTYTYFFAVTARTSSEVLTGFAPSPGAGEIDTNQSYSPGWEGTGGFNGAYGAFGTSTPVAMTVLELAQEPLFLGQPPNGEVIASVTDLAPWLSPQNFHRTFVTALTTGPLPFQTRQDHSVVIPDTEIFRPSGTLRVKQQTVVLPDLPIDTITAEPHTLSFTSPIWLARRFVQSVVVKRHSDSAVLTRTTTGSDGNYKLAPESGALFGVVNTADYLVDIDYQAGQQQYHLIYVDPLTAVVGVVSSTVRAQDPEEYRPACPSGKIPLYAVYSFRIPNYMCIELIPVHAFRNYVRIGKEAEHVEWLDHCRKYLPKTFKKLIAGSPIRVAGYGDSNMYMGGASGSITRRTDGDAPGFFTSQRGASDTTAALTTFSQDSNTKVAVNYPYFVKAAIENGYGCKVTYDNFGISGSTTSSGTFGGSNSARMTALIAGGYDLVIISLGTNTFVASEYTTIVSTFQAAGIEVIVLGTPPWNFYAGTQLAGSPPIASWTADNEAMRRIALAKNAAYVYTPALFGRGNEGATGLSQRSLAATSTTNHGGIAERRHIGEYMALIFDGQIGVVPTGLSVPTAPIVVPTTGFSITIANTTRAQILDPAGTLATGTVTMCPAPRDGQIVEISSTQIITGFTVSANAGQSIKNAPTTIAAGGCVSFRYDGDTTTWYRRQ